MDLQAVPSTAEKTPVVFFSSTPVLIFIAGENHKIRANVFTIKTTSAHKGPQSG